MGGVAVAVDLATIDQLRHFQSTELDRVISEFQKQARLGWSTMHVARHYTGAVSPEDRRAAEHMDTPSSADERTPVTGQRSRNASLRRPGSHCQSPRRQRLCAGGQCGSLRSGVGAEVSVEESLDSSARDPEAAVDREHRQRQVTPLDGPVDRRSALAQEHGGVLDAEERLGAHRDGRAPPGRSRCDGRSVGRLQQARRWCRPAAPREQLSRRLAGPQPRRAALGYHARPTTGHRSPQSR